MEGSPPTIVDCPSLRLFFSDMGMHWLGFRRPTRLLWTDFNALNGVLVIYIVYSLIMFISCGMLIWRRNHFLFRKVPLSAALMGALMQWLIVSLNLYRYVKNTSLTIWMMILRNYVLFPVGLAASIPGRAMPIIFEAIWAWSIEDPTRLREASRNENKGLYWWRQWSLKNPILQAKLKKHCNFVMLTFITLIHCATGFVQYLTVEVDESLPYKGYLSKDEIGLVTAAVLYMLIWSPVLFYFLTKIEKSHGLRRDLQIGVSYAIPFYVLYASFRGYDFLQFTRDEISSHLWLMMAMVTLHCATVMSPLLRSFKCRQMDIEIEPSDLIERQSTKAGAGTTSGSPGRSPYDLTFHDGSLIIRQKLIPFSTVLQHPHLSKYFEEYSKKALVWDCLLFFRAVDRYRQLVIDNSVDEAKEEAFLIRREFIDPGSPCEMNIGSAVLNRLKGNFDGHLLADLYDEAQAEIIRLVGNCSYKNFLHGLDQHRKEQFLMPIAHPIDTGQS